MTARPVMDRIWDKTMTIPESGTGASEGGVMNGPDRNPYGFKATTTAGRIEELAKLLARECPLGELLLAVAKTEDGTSPGIRERVRGRG